MNANVFRFSIVPLIVALCVSVVPLRAAPVESVQSARATTAIQQIDAFLSQQAVAQRLTELGITRDQVDARLAQLSDAQLQQLAAQVDLIQAGGDIQGGNPHPLGPIECVFQSLGRFLHDLYKLLFCWSSQH